MNKNLEKGDIVMLRNNNEWGLSEDNPVGIKGIVIGYDFWDWIRVRWSNGFTNFYRPNASDLELVGEK